MYAPGLAGVRGPAAPSFWTYPVRPGLPTATATVRVIAWVTEPDIRTP